MGLIFNDYYAYLRIDAACIETDIFRKVECCAINVQWQ